MQVRQRIGRVAALAAVAAACATTAAVDASAAPAAAGIPPAPTNPYTDTYDFAARAQATITKLGARADVPESGYLSYLRLCVEVSQQGTDDPTNCPEFAPPTTSFDSFDNPSFPVWIQATGPIWVKSPAGASQQYGTYAPVTVSGTVGGKAVSATVQLSQPVAGGQVTPFQLSLLTTASPVPAEGGTVNARGEYPAVTFGPNRGNQYLVEQAKITGALNVRITKLTVGGRAVSPGDSCRTSSAAPVALSSPAGTYDAQTPASSLRGRPGGFQPLSPDDPGSLQGNVSIPSFTGCKAAGADVSPLVTALVSGPRNAVDFDLTAPFRARSSAAR